MNLKEKFSTTFTKVKHAAIKTASFCKHQARLFMIGFMTTAYAITAAAQTSKGASGFSSAQGEIASYQEPVKNLMYAIAAVIALIGAFNVYFKMQNGDQDVKKTIMMTIGGCVAMVAMATALPMFFK